MEEPEKDAILSCDENTNHGDDSRSGFEKIAKNTDNDDEDDEGTTKGLFDEESESEGSEEESDSCKYQYPNLRVWEFRVSAEIFDIVIPKIYNRS